MNRLAVLFLIFFLLSLYSISQPVIQAAISGLEDDQQNPVLMPEDMQIQPAPDDPYYLKQWTRPWFSNIDELIPEREVRVAVLDTGIDLDHEDLEGRVIAGNNLIPTVFSSDLNGHGTHIAGAIAAQINNGTGIAGIAPFSRLLDVRVADSLGRSNAALIAEGIVWAADQDAGVINISITIDGATQEMEEAVDYAWNKGAIIIASVSNKATWPVYPAGYANCIAVAAIDQEGQICPAGYDKGQVNIAAPGYSIYSTLPHNSYGYKSGTSMAAAQVSGLAALLYSIAIDRNGNGHINDEIRAAIEASSTYSEETGIKIIDPALSIAIFKEKF